MDFWNKCNFKKDLKFAILELVTMTIYIMLSSLFIAILISDIHSSVTMTHNIRGIKNFVRRIKKQLRHQFIIY